MAPPRTVKVYFPQTGGSMACIVQNDSTTAHLLQAIATHVGITDPDQKNVQYKVMGLGPVTARCFVEVVDIRALIKLSPDFLVEVTQGEVPRLENLPTTSHKKKRRDTDEDDKDER
ncbi:hypothetical protein HK104_005887, partial [Borealophlyctis nickersoniae]